MRTWILTGLMTAAALARAQQPTNPAYELAALREDLHLLQQRVGELSLAVEQLNRDNTALQAKASQSYVTLEQLNQALAGVNHATQVALADQKHEVLAQVAAQIEKLAHQTQAAIDAVARSQATRPAMQANFSEDYPKDGVSYTVQAGDTLAVIAKKNGAKVQDIINANKISDPSRIRAGQTLFIPQAK